MWNPTKLLSSPSSGVWVGIDLGTSNSACAVWDSSRGRPKWIRLGDIAIPERGGTKSGRLVPTLVKKGCNPPATFVGEAARKNRTGTLLSSVKRLLGRKRSDLDPIWLASLPYKVVEDPNAGNGELLISFSPIGSDQVMLQNPVEIIGSVLESIRESAQSYLDKYGERKNMEVPGGGGSGNGTRSGEPPRILNVVVGVPAHFSKRQIQLVEKAARLGGFRGTVSTCVESNAAAMAYGLSLQHSSEKRNMMVIDMGGGTTDISIASSTFQSSETNLELETPSFQVLVTKGDENLGGDDIDNSILEYCLRTGCTDSSVGHEKSPALLQACREVKERLCDLESPSEIEKVTLPAAGAADGASAAAGDSGGYSRASTEIPISQVSFEEILNPWLQRARALVTNALEDFNRVSDTPISEVVLVGGTSRIPAVRRLLQTEFFPDIELSTSLNPMSSVAQGLAIQAAILSRCVSGHQLRSALMLDCLPHAIGVLLGGTNARESSSGDDAQQESKVNFVEILKRNAPLPARGSSKFSLADKRQNGVSLEAVEMVGFDRNGVPVYEPIAREPFTFLLRRLPASTLQTLKVRSVEVGMSLGSDGQFTVSIFDEMDPEQVRKREYFRAKNGGDVEDRHGIHYLSVLLSADGLPPSEQVVLVGVLIVVTTLYVFAKVFSTTSVDDDTQF
eukprot:Nitzschia sp. Nitz4//scaffold99_size76975//59186//61216//NITZ4_005582-RA/size76975-processed-gene-0.52-mRNA-1//-1//CDS//3329560868//1882//frame0